MKSLINCMKSLQKIILIKDRIILGFEDKVDELNIQIIIGEKLMRRYKWNIMKRVKLYNREEFYGKDI